MWLKTGSPGPPKPDSPAAAASLTDDGGQPVGLGSSLGGGKEGEVHEVLGSRYVVKLLRPPNRTPDREQKLRLMVARPPNDPTLSIGHVSICWPLKLVFEPPDHFAGFLMPRVDTVDSPQLLRFIFPKYYPGVFSWRNQVEIAANFAGSLAALHDAQYVVGDLNLKNIHVTQACLVTFVDCDSFQVPGPAGGEMLRCGVGVPEYTAPEFQGLNFAEVDRTPSSDVFAFSVILCQLLLAGTHPFAGGKGQTREENIGSGDSMFLRPVLPRGTPSLEVLPPPIAALLRQCFVEGHRDPSRRPSMAEYAGALGEARDQVRSCTIEPERHTFGNHRETCPWCEMSARFGFDPYRPEPRKAHSPLPAVGPKETPEPAAVGFAGLYRRALRRQRLSRAVVLAALLLALGFVVTVGWQGLEFGPPTLGSSAIRVGGVRIDLLAGLRRTMIGIRGSARGLWSGVARGRPGAPMRIPPEHGVPNPLVVNTPVLCTGLDSSGFPVRPQGSFFESDASRRPLNVYIPFQNALPGKTALQVRWLVAGKEESSSALFSPDTSDGAILVPYRGLLSAGSHRIVVVADGVERGSVTFTVSPSRARKKAAAVSSPAAPVQPAPQARVQAPPESPPPVAEPSPRVLQELPPAASQNPAQKRPRVFKARHKHRLGTCSGELVLEAERMTFTSFMHTFKWSRQDLMLHEDGVEDAKSKRWHFVIEGQDARELFSRWLRGEP